MKQETITYKDLPINSKNPYVHGLFNTTTTKTDSRLQSGLVNAILVESGSEQPGVRCRPGVNNNNLGATAISYNAIFGAHYWDVNSTFYFVTVESGVYKLYRNEAASYTDDSTFIQNVTGGTFEQRFEFIEYYDGTNHKLILLTGTDGYIITAAHAVTHITDGDFPNPHIPLGVALDGYLFVAQRATNKIYNSLATDPTTWQASTYTTTEQRGGQILGLLNHYRSICAITTHGVEFFKDGGIANPNSPLIREADRFLQYRGFAPHMMCTYDDKIWFIGKDLRTGSSMSLIEITEYRAKEHATKAVSLAASNGAVWGATSTSESVGWSYPLYPIKWEDRVFLVWDSTSVGSTKVSYSVSGAPPALVYDPLFDAFYFWSYTKNTTDVNWTTAASYLQGGMQGINSYGNHQTAATTSQGDPLYATSLAYVGTSTARAPIATLLSGFSSQGFDYTGGSRKVSIEAGVHLVFGEGSPQWKTIFKLQPVFTTNLTAANTDGNLQYIVKTWKDAENIADVVADVSLGPYSMWNMQIPSNLGRYRTCRLAVRWTNGTHAPILRGLKALVMDTTN